MNVFHTKYRNFEILLSSLLTSPEFLSTLCPQVTGASNTAFFFCHLHGRLRLKCDGTRAETRFRLSAKRTSPFKSAGASVQSTTGSRCVRISGSNAGYTMFRGSVKSTGYPLHSPVSPSLPPRSASLCAITFNCTALNTPADRRLQQRKTRPLRAPQAFSSTGQLNGQSGFNGSYKRK